MWEWSNRILSRKKPSTSKSLLAAYNDLLLQTSVPTSTGVIKNQDIAAPRDNDSPGPDTLSMQQQLEQKIAEYGLHHLELREYLYDPQTWQEMNTGFYEYLHARAMFLKLLGYSYAEECLAAGLTKADIKILRLSYAPENYNTHLKIPFDFGGTLDFSNFALIKTHPTHGMIHRLIDYQIESDYLRHQQKIFIPYFEGRIYHD